MIDPIGRLALSYLLGSILGSAIVGHLRGVDIRALGSGNAGAANALRTQGAGFALGVLLIDAGKGWLATRVISQLSVPLAPPTSVIHNWLPAGCGAAALLGHVYPLWFRFQGGKAVATLFGALAGLAPGVLVPALIVWLMVVVLSGFVSIASIAAALSAPLGVVAEQLAWQTPLLTFTLLAAGLVLFTHRSNLRRLREGREPRARRLWWRGRHAP